MLKYVNICLIRIPEEESKEKDIWALFELFERDHVCGFSKSHERY